MDNSVTEDSILIDIASSKGNELKPHEAIEGNLSKLLSLKILEKLLSIFACRIKLKVKFNL